MCWDKGLCLGEHQQSQLGCGILCKLVFLAEAGVWSHRDWIRTVWKSSGIVSMWQLPFVTVYSPSSFRIPSQNRL